MRPAYAVSCLAASGLLWASAFVLTLLAAVGRGVPVSRRYAVVYYGEANDHVARLVLERNYTIVVAQPYFKIPREWIERGVRVYAYLNVLGLEMNMYDWVREHHPEWPLYTREGEPAKYWYGSSFMCNIAVESFQDYLVSKAREYLRRGFTGIFLDDVHLDISGIGGPQYDTPVYDEARYGRWLDALTKFIVRLRNETGASLIYNAGWSKPSPELMKYVDGVMLEAHPTTYVVTSSWESVTNPRYVSRPWSTIYENSLAAQEYAEQGKIVIALSYGESLETYEYSYAVARLFDFYYWVSPPIINRVLETDVLDLDLGEPLGGHGVLGPIYYRVYEEGLVAVNPGGEEATAVIEVPSNWTTLRRIDGRAYRVEDGKLRVSLGPGEGVILLLNVKAGGRAGEDAGWHLLAAAATLPAAILVAAILARRRRAGGRTGKNP